MSEQLKNEIGSEGGKNRSEKREFVTFLRGKFRPVKLVALHQVREPVIVERRWHTTPKMRVSKRDGR